MIPVYTYTTDGYDVFQYTPILVFYTGRKKGVVQNFKKGHFSARHP